MNQREIALEIIYKTMSDASYSGLLMRKRLNILKPNERPFVTNLVNMVLKKYDYLIYQIKDEIKDNTKLKNKIIIAMALYEKHYLKEKDYVVNNEYVKLANNKYDKAFINALLHKDIIFEKASEEYVNHSLPKWIYDLLNKQYSKDELEIILNNYERIPLVNYRINHLKANKDDFEDVKFLNDDIFISNKKLINLDYIDKGLAYIQDINSSSLYKAFDLKEDDLLLDVCSAPGSKLFNCLDIINPKNAYANEIYERRLNLIKEKAKILGYDDIHYLNYDGRDLKDKLNIKFDKIMLDVPCSGLGTIGRKPDLKYHIMPSSLDELELLQKELLTNNAFLLKNGGQLLYSTCTLNKKENHKQIENFLKNHHDFKLIKEETIINEIGDLFYYALIQKGYN